MDKLSHRLKLLTLTWLIILASQGAVGTSRTDLGDCPPDAVERMTQCTQGLMQIQKGSDRASLIKYCRTLKQVPVCLERILHQCQGHAELGPIDSMKDTITQFKTRFDRVCEPLCGQCNDGPSPNAKAVSSSDSVCHQAEILTVLCVVLIAVFAL